MAFRRAGKAILIATALSLSLSACGVKKPLYLPTEKDIEDRKARDIYRAQKKAEREKTGVVPGDKDEEDERDDDHDDDDRHEKKNDKDDDDYDDKPRSFNW